MPWVTPFSVGLDSGTLMDDQDYQVPFRFPGKLTVTLRLNGMSPARRGN